MKSLSSSWRDLARLRLPGYLHQKWPRTQIIRKVTSDPQNGESLSVASENGAAKRLSRAEFQGLGEMPPEVEWFANLDNPRTRRAYRLDVKEFTAFAGVERPEEMRQVTRAHLIAWRKDLERRGLAP
jgi:DNA gyrase/topoisomerase IV subunit B